MSAGSEISTSRMGAISSWAPDPNTLPARRERAPGPRRNRRPIGGCALECRRTPAGQDPWAAPTASGHAQVLQRGRDQLGGLDRPRGEQPLAHHQERRSDIDPEPGRDAGRQRDPERVAGARRVRPSARQDRDHVGRHHRPFEIRRELAHGAEHGLGRRLDNPAPDVHRPVALAGLPPALARRFSVSLMPDRVTGGACRALIPAYVRRIRRRSRGYRTIHADRQGTSHPAPGDRDPRGTFRAPGHASTVPEPGTDPELEVSHVQPNVVLPLASSLLSFVSALFLLDQWLERRAPTS